MLTNKNPPEDFKDLINLRIAREERLACAHLREDGSNGPHIDAGSVLATTEKNLWRAIPQCDNLSIVLA
jgi:hypothetical protein